MSRFSSLFYILSDARAGLAIRSENILVEDQGSDVIWSMHKEISIPALILWPLSDRTDIAASS